MPLQLDDVGTVVGLAMKAAIGPVTEELASLRAELARRHTVEQEWTKRLAVVEALQPVPGPPGANGQDGKDGEPGPPGAPGKFADQYKETFRAGTTYVAGDIVTDDGIWLCKAVTTTDRPGYPSPAWKLILARPDRKGAR